MSKKLAGLIVLGLASATPAFAAGQAEAKGFVEDSALNVLLRNAFINRDYKGGRHDSGEWGQGAIANFESGFTQPEFDSSKAHFRPTPSNGAGFRATGRQKPRYTGC